MEELSQEEIEYIRNKWGLLLFIFIPMLVISLIKRLCTKGRIPV